MHALKPMTQQWVMLQRPENLQDAIVLAERADSTLMWQRRVPTNHVHQNHQQ